jgi:hypothetical protein
MYSDSLGLAEEYAQIEPVVVPDVIDENTGKPAEITIKMVLLNVLIHKVLVRKLILIKGIHFIFQEVKVLWHLR